MMIVTATSQSESVMIRNVKTEKMEETEKTEETEETEKTAAKKNVFLRIKQYILICLLVY